MLAAIPSNFFEKKEFQYLISVVGNSIATSPHAAQVFAVGSLFGSAIVDDGENLNFSDEDHVAPSTEREEDYTYAETEDHSYLNIGLQHDAHGWQQVKKEVYEAIKEKRTDIVALEYSSRFFKHLGEYAKRQGKEVQYLEGNSGGRVGLLATVGGLALALAMYRLNLFDPRERSQWLKEYGLSWFVTQLGITPPSLMLSVYLNQNSADHRYYARHDVSYTGDARTVFMKLALDKIRAENPGKRVVTITGDIHAKGIEMYSRDSHAFELAVKGLIYNLVYYFHKREKPLME